MFTIFPTSSVKRVNKHFSIYLLLLLLTFDLFSSAVLVSFSQFVLMNTTVHHIGHSCFFFGFLFSNFLFTISTFWQRLNWWKIYMSVYISICFVVSCNCCALRECRCVACMCVTIFSCRKKVCVYMYVCRYLCI